VNESHVVKYGYDETVTVTPIDANHCPGAAMYLFEGHFGRILYTGDFRYSGPMLNNMSLHSLRSTNIDVLFLDNTFCDARCIFPSRENAIQEMLRVIRRYPDAQIKIGMKNLGKEEMLVALARGLDEWIGVSQERYHVLELLCMANVFKVSSSCRIQVVMQSEINAKRMKDWNFVQQTIAIIPTGIYIALASCPFPQRQDVHIIPYSNHSSYEELQQFVSLIEPRKIHPILGPDLKDRLAQSLPNRADMSCFQVTVDDVDPVQTEPQGSSSVLSSEQQASVSSSYSTNSDNSTTETTRPKFRKTNKRKVFSFTKKTQMGVVFSSSESPLKRPKDVMEQSVITAADSAGATSEENNNDFDADADTPMEVICLDPADNVCNSTTDRNQEEDQRYNHSDKVCSLQHDSDCPTSVDKNLMNSYSGVKNMPCSSSQDKGAPNLDSLDTAWMMQVLQPLIAKEADKIIRERQSFGRPFRK